MVSISSSQQPSDLGPQRTQQRSCYPSVPERVLTQPHFPSPSSLAAGVPLLLCSPLPPWQPLSELECLAH